MKPLSVTCLTILLMVLAACSPVLQVEPAPAFEPAPVAVGVEETNRYWWQLRFKLTWPEGEEPDFSRHLLIAEQLLLPVIVEHQAGMPLWRFHRRAVRTPAGHQFSLLFFSDSETAEAVHDRVASDPVTAWLTDQGLIERVRFDQRSPDELGRLELTSDEDWPLEVQRSWPYYIMGASQAWLMQVQALSAEQGLSGKLDYPALLAHYREVDAQLNAQWRENGQSAYFHHLSAIYGYQPLFIDTKGLQAF